MGIAFKKAKTSNLFGARKNSSNKAGEDHDPAAQAPRSLQVGALFCIQLAGVKPSAKAVTPGRWFSDRCSGD
jgi:hypothetical protein